MITDKVKATIKKYGLLKKGDSLVVGVSGGPDSVALLYLLKDLSKELNLSLHVAHLDHMMRADSSLDRKFVETLAEKLNIPFTCARVNITQLAAKGSLEEIARNARLGFLFRVCREHHTKKIALGHNLDDQAETVLMRILRGAGLYGLSAILPKRNIAGYEIIRPLIEVKRKEIEAYLKKRRVKPRLDSTNLDEVYFRNRIREDLLPLLEKKYNRNIREVLANMAQSSGSDYEYLRNAATCAMKGVKTQVSLSRLARLHPAIQRLVLRQCIANTAGDTRRLTFQHIREIEDLIANRPPDSIVDLPKNVAVTKKKNRLIFRLKKRQ